MFTTLISAAELAAHLGDSGYIVFDCRFDLTNTEAGRRAYGESHIPDAHYLHLDEHLAGPKSGTNGLRGTGYEYFRNEGMDTIDFFSKRAVMSAMRWVAGPICS